MSKIKRNKIIVGALLLLILVHAAAPFLQAKNVCMDALVRCEADALIVGAFGGIEVFGTYAAGCLVGYAWCLRYYIKRV